MKKSYQGITLEGRRIEAVVEHGKITEVRDLKGGNALPLIAPPLVDLQHNGSAGKSFKDAHKDPEVLGVVARCVRRHGVGRLFPTLITQPIEDHLAALAAIRRTLEQDAGLRRLYPGIFFEGNYMSTDFGWRGVHHEGHMRPPNWDEWARLQEAAGGLIRIFNVDPAQPGAMAAIEQAVKNNIRISLGHCGPDADTIRRAADLGADLVTHFGNGAPPMIPRHRNPFWTWLADERFKIGLIADGHHLPGDVISTVIAAKGRDKVFLVSDAVATSGRPPGIYGNVQVDEGGFTHPVGERELLAGAWFQADRCVERMCELGWTLSEAWKLASITPAKILGIPLPKIAAGEPAEFVLSRWTGGQLVLEQVVDLGEELLKEPVNPRTV